MNDTIERHTADTVPCILAYWRKTWVAVPLFYVPKTAIRPNGTLQVHWFELIDAETGEPLPEEPQPPFVPSLGYLAVDAKVNRSIIPWLWSTKDLKTLCKINHIPFFWITGELRITRKFARTQSDRRAQRKVQALTPHEFKLLRKELRSLDPQTHTIARLLWFLNNLLKDGGDYITLEEILRMKERNIEQEFGVYRIELSRGMHLISLCIPHSLGFAVQKHIQHRSIRDSSPLLRIIELLI